MAKPNKKLRRISRSEQSEPFNSEEFREMLKSLIENPSDANLDHINRIRLWFSHSTIVTRHIGMRMRGLTWKLRDPNEEDLEMIYAMISSCRRLFEGGKLLVEDYEILHALGVIAAEIDAFKIACRELQEATYFVEAVYLSLPDRLEINEFLRSN